MRAIAPSMPPHTCLRQGRRRPTSRFCAADANGTDMRQCWSARRKATAIDKNSSNVRRHEDQLATVHTKPDIFTLPRCESAELFFFCCESVAALALANCNEHVAEKNITAPAHTKRALCTAPKAREVRVVKSLNFPVRDTRARATGISCFPCQTSTRIFLRSSAPSRPFSRAFSPPPGFFFARDCAHAGGPVR
jgi:hypothetical protein